MEDCVLIIDDDKETADFLCNAFIGAGMIADTATDAFAAIEKLRERHYSAIVLDPMIRHRLNGYAVLNFIELEQPQTLERLFLLTGMSEQTIRRTVPSVLPRLYRKPYAATSAAAAVIEMCDPSRDRIETKRGRSVLLIEDDQVTAAATRAILEELEFTVESVANGRDALEALAARKFDVIMLDLVMPHVDGFTVLEHFRSKEPSMLRRVIVTTGIPDKYLEALDRCAIRGILQKPLNVRKLEQLLADDTYLGTVAFEAGGELPEL